MLPMSVSMEIKINQKYSNVTINTGIILHFRVELF